MSNPIPCFTDSDENRFPDEADVEDESPLTLMENRLEWMFSEWQESLKDDNYEVWRDIRMMCYGATQALIHTTGRYEDSRALALLSGIAFERSLQCIRDERIEA